MTLSAENPPAPDAAAGVDPLAAAEEVLAPREPQPGMIEQIKALYQDGRDLIDAEVNFQRARLSAVGKQVRVMALLGFVGLVLLGCVLIALTVGTMIALIPVLGAWGAMGATVVGSLILAALCFWLAFGRIGKVTALFADDTAPATDET